MPLMEERMNSVMCFQLETVSGRLQITGTTGVAASMGFYYFLKQYCGCQYTWAGHQLRLPATFPTIASPGVTIQVNDRCADLGCPHIQ